MPATRRAPIAARVRIARSSDRKATMPEALETRAGPNATRRESEWQNSSATGNAPTPAANCAPSDLGADATLLGWVHRVRDLGGVLFIDIRDRAGISQVVVRDDEALLAQAKRLRPEFVVGVRGLVERRSAETVNPKLATGEVEVLAREIPAAERGEDAAVPDCRRLAGVGGRAAALPLSRSAAAAAAGATSACATAWRSRSASTSTSTASGRSRRRS